jgi:hypothetical protein
MFVGEALLVAPGTELACTVGGAVSDRRRRPHAAPLVPAGKVQNATRAAGLSGARRRCRAREVRILARELNPRHAASRVIVKEADRRRERADFLSSFSCPHADHRTTHFSAGGSSITGPPSSRKNSSSASSPPTTWSSMWRLIPSRSCASASTGTRCRTDAFGPGPARKCKHPSSSISSTRTLWRCCRSASRPGKSTDSSLSR